MNCFQPKRTAASYFVSTWGRENSAIPKYIKDVTYSEFCNEWDRKHGATNTIQSTNLWTAYIGASSVNQTFQMWKTNMKFGLKRAKKCRHIYLQPLIDNGEPFPDFITDFRFNKNSHLSINAGLFSVFQHFLQVFFGGFSVNILPELQLKARARKHSKTGKRQLLVTDIVRKQRKFKPKNGYCILGISWTDLYPSEKLNFVLGEAFLAQKSAVFCFGRFEPKSFTDQDVTEITGSLLWRLLKCIAHETCHLFGILHCTYFDCLMNESSSLKEAEEQPLFLCPVCLKKLQYICGFDVMERYKSLLIFIELIESQHPTPKWTESKSWLQNLLQNLI